MHTLKKEYKQHLDKKLFFRLLIYFLISDILLVVIGYEIFFQLLPIEDALIGLSVGLLIGIITARMFIFSWDKDAKKIISQLDFVGIIILGCYIIFAVVRREIISNLVQANYITGTSISVATGIMIGRIVGTGNKINAILKEQNLS